ncbi:MAG TPA: HAMP domain-containing sensor histidine kinase [Saprospiraceae bacterium]|nr:HAMP domain-containing sensor histidine kinase [Saprospiraceae bacterium]
MITWINRNWGLIALAAFVVLYLTSIRQNTKLNITDNIRTTLQERFVQDSLVFSHEIEGRNFAALDQSPYKIQILKNGRLIYWNTTLHCEKELKRIINDEFEARFFLDFQNPESIRRFTENSKFLYNGDQFILKSSIKLNNWAKIFFIIFFAWLCLSVLGPRSRLADPLVLIPGIFSVLSLGIFSIVWLFDDHSTVSDVDSISRQYFNLFTLSIFIICLTSIVIYQGQRFIDWVKSKIPAKAYVFGSVVLISMLFCSLILLLNFFISDYIITFDYNNVLILNWHSITALILVLLSTALLFFISYLVVKSAPDSYFRSFANAGISIAAITLSVLSLWAIGYPLLPLGIFLLSFFLILELFVESSIRNITSMLWWLILFSAFISINLFYLGLQNDIKYRSQILNKLYHQPNDQESKNIQRIAKKFIDKDIIYSLSQLEYPARLQKSDFEEFVFDLSHNLLKNTDWKIQDVEVFNEVGESIFVNNYPDYQSFVQRINLSSRIDKLVLYDHFSDSYILEYSIENSSFDSAPFKLIIILSRKNTVTDVDESINYVVIRDGVIVKSQLDVNSASISVNPLKINNNTIISDISFVVKPLPNGQKIVSFRKIAGLIKPISFFSFIFTLGAVILALITYLNTKFRFLPRDIDIKYFAKTSLRSKIQLTIILLIVFSFIIIGFITAIYFKTVFETNQKNTRTKEIATIVSSIQNFSQGSSDIAGANEITKNKIAAITSLHNVSIKFYDQFGKLLSNQAALDDNSRIDFNILQDILKNQNSITEYDKTYNYQKTYTPLYHSKTGKFRGILMVEYNKKDPAIRSIVDFVGTILNVYIFLFLLAGAISIAISNSITKPLSQLGDKLRQFKLGKENQSLEWSGNDEIGMLINDYNNLAEELSQSAELLARTERDMAWREMAKQVAHEIKNPLTPMKLSMQYLEKAIDANPEKAKELIQRISSTLIEQIENLNQIASEFSNFAKMPSTTNENVILNEVVETIHDLFRKREDMDISLNEPIEDLTVYADRNQLVRILNNLVKNAIQAIPHDKKGKIVISLYKSDKDAIISIQDNGTGIPESMRDKVFTPNFTTKSSGTGLGLAISANMIDTMNGKIYFETEENEGTTFFVQIPLMRLDDDMRVVVSLDD